MSDEVLSFRSYITAGMAEFSTGFDDPNLGSDLLTELVVVLSNYQEEGIHLFPVVFVTDHLSNALVNLGGSDAIVIGSEQISRQTIRTAFKQCAPLAEDRQWAIFMEIHPDCLNYGIFRTEQSPLSPTAFERLRQNKVGSGKIVGLTRLGGNFVEIRIPGGKYRYIDISGTQEETNHPPRLLRNFMSVIAEDAPSDLKRMLEAFYYQLGVDILHSNHGRLIAIIQSQTDVPSFLKDGIFLNPKIEILDGIAQFRTQNDITSYQRLTAWSRLLRRMTIMDGITVLDTRGAIVGYNCFIQSSILEARTQAVLGGARRRAFDVLVSFLGRELKGALYRSQDGIAAFKSK